MRRLSCHPPHAPVGFRRWWLLLSPDGVDVCEEDPGFDVDVWVKAPLRVFVRVWRGDLDWSEALGPGEIELHGRRELCRQLPDWFTRSDFAPVTRPRPSELPL